MFNNLGHPFPALLFDQVTELIRQEKIKTSKLVTANEFYLSGHFPGEPILPGVFILEGIVPLGS